MSGGAGPAAEAWGAFEDALAELATEPFTGLDIATACGRACVACGRVLNPGRDVPGPRPTSAPIGLAEGGGRVYACVADGCAELAQSVLAALAVLLLDGQAVRVGPDRYTARGGPW